MHGSAPLRKLESLRDTRWFLRGRDRGGNMSTGRLGNGTICTNFRKNNIISGPSSISWWRRRRRERYGGRSSNKGGEDTIEET